MKRVKKALGAVLALSMLLTSAAVMPLQGSAADYPELALETFDDWSEDVAGAEVPNGSVGPHGWTRYGAPGSFSGQIDDEGGNKYLTLTTTWAGAGVSFAEAGKDGVYKITASVKTNSLADDGKAAVMLGNSQHVIPLLLQGDGTVRTGSAIGTDPNNTTDTVNNPIGTYDPDAWVDVEIIHNMDIGRTSMVLYQNDVEIAHKYLTDTSSLGMFNMLGFKYISDTGSMSIDNVSVERIFETDGLTVYAENFNTVKYDQLKYLLGAAQEIGSGDITDGVHNIDASSGGWPHTSIKLGGLRGRYTITFKIKTDTASDVRLQSGEMGEVPLMGLGTGRVWIGEKASGYSPDAFKNAASSGTVSVNEMASCNISDWIEVTAVFDTENAIMSTRFEQNGQLLAFSPVRGVPGLDAGLDYIRFRAPGGVTSVDDIKLVCGGSVADGATVLVDEDFSNFSETSSENNKNGWIDGMNPGDRRIYSIYEENGNKMLLLDNSLGDNRVMYTTGSSIDRGDITIDFDAKLSGTNPNFLFELVNSADENADVTGTTAIRPHGGNHTVWLQYHADHGADNVTLTTFENDVWYHYTITVHPKEATYDVKMYEGNETTPMAEMNGLQMQCTGAQNVPQHTFKAIRLRLWGDATCKAYFDNLKMVYDIERPKLDESGVTMVDSADAVVTNYDEVDSALKTITLDYGTELANAGTVTLADDTGDTVEFTGEIVGETYVMTLNEILKDGTDYTLSASGAVGVNGNAQDMSLEMRFTTAEMGSDIVRLDKLTNEAGEDITSLSQLSGTFTVNTSAVNRTDEARDLIWIVAYYNGDRFVDAQMQTDVLDANSALVNQPEFTALAMTDITKVKVFLWDTLDDMVPYCDALELTQ